MDYLPGFAPGVGDLVFLGSHPSTGAEWILKMYCAACRGVNLIDVAAY